MQQPAPGEGPPPRKEPPFGLTSTYLRAFAFFMLAAAIILFLIVRLGDSGTSAHGDDSPEAGFARDMKTHHAQAVEMATIVRDRVRYRVPFGALGEVVAGGMVRSDLERIFEYRRVQMMSLFPPAATPGSWDEA